MIKQVKIFLICLIILTVSLSFKAFAIEHENLIKIRVAILEDFTAEKYSKERAHDFFSGIFVATQAARQKGFLIEYKTFTYYGYNSLKVLDPINEVKAWKPDFIIGPRVLNQFLLITKYFKDILVVSSGAGPDSIVDLPSNFYNLSLPASYRAKADVLFVKKYLPSRNIFAITHDIA